MAAQLRDANIEALTAFWQTDIDRLVDEAIQIPTPCGGPSANF
jgi:hypothetical protein